MDKLSTTKMSSRGQVVIPEEIRKRLGLNPGVQFVVVGKNDVIILKALKQPSMDEFDSLMAEARAQARRAGLKRSAISAAIGKVRKRR